jgi:hypothetical protein
MTCNLGIGNRFADGNILERAPRALLEVANIEGAIAVHGVVRAAP